MKEHKHPRKAPSPAKPERLGDAMPADAAETTVVVNATKQGTYRGKTFGFRESFTIAKMADFDKDWMEIA